MNGQLMLALTLAFIVTALIDYLKLPLKNTPFIIKWMVAHGLAHVKEDGHTIWFLPYISFALGLVGSYILRVNVFLAYAANMNPITSYILTAIVVGLGSKVIHDVTSGKATAGLISYVTPTTTLDACLRDSDVCCDDKPLK